VRANPTQAESQEAVPVITDLTWRCHPARRQPVKAAVVLAFHVLVCALLAAYTASWPFALILTLVLLLSLSAFFFPTVYRLSREGVRVKTLVTSFERPWSTYRSHWPDRNGVLLSPFPRRSRLENFRGLFVRYDGNGDVVLAFVRQFVPEPETDA
jgi:hypothetical protein